MRPRPLTVLEQMIQQMIAASKQPVGGSGSFHGRLLFDHHPIL